MAQEIVIPPLNYGVTERIYRRAKELAREGSEMHGQYDAQCAARAGARAAEAKSPKLMHCLERVVEILDRVHEEQRGRTKRDASTARSYRSDPSVLGAFKEAFRCAQDGLEAPEYGYLYAACAEYVGVI